jgi:homopolymeric O-antigen transport system permease protein
MSHVLDGAATARPDDVWVIEPQRDGVTARAAELWRYRRVLWFLATRTVKDRYEGMSLGIFWLFARPLIPILLGGFVFGGLLGLPSDGVPFVLFFMTGIVPWTLFERSILFGTKCLNQHRGLMKKLYFPRLISPIASISPAAADFVIYLLLLCGVALFYLWKDGVMYVKLGPSLVLALLMSVLAVFSALSVIFWTCVFQARHQETRFTLRYFMQFWMYLTPVFYPISVVPPEHRWIVYVNPMASVVATFRWGVIGVGELPLLPLATAIVVAFVAMAAGIWFFTANESSTIDRL